MTVRRTSAQVTAAPGLVLGGADSGDERLGNARVGAVEEEIAGDVGLLRDLEGGYALPVGVDELFNERAVAVDVGRA
ncbi:MAG: hypothetical protein ACRDNO_02920 [Trebonia sp.]